MKKTFLILFSAIFATLLSSCEKVPSLTNFIDEALNGCVSIACRTMYIDGEKVWSYNPDMTGESYSRYQQHGLLLFYSDGTCRKCYSLPPDAEPLGFNTAYRTLHWQYDAVENVIRLTDNSLLAKDARFAVTELKLTSRSGNNLGFRGLIPTDGYSTNAEVYCEFSGTLLDASKRVEAESLYRNEEESPLLK